MGEEWEEGREKFRMALVYVMNANWVVCYRDNECKSIRRKAVSIHLNVLLTWNCIF